MCRVYSIPVVNSDRTWIRINITVAQCVTTKPGGLLCVGVIMCGYDDMYKSV